MKSAFLQEYVKFLKNSPTPYHVVFECENLLSKDNFVKCTIKELERPGKYYLIFHHSLIIVVEIPKNPKTLKIIAAHNDSPVLKLRPNFLKNKKASLSTYGGGLWHTWFDRSLCVGGLIVTSDLNTELFKIDQPMFYIPSLPPHLDRGDVYKDGFSYDKEKHLTAICNLNCVKSFFVGKDVISHDLSLFDADEPRFLGKENELIVSARQDNLLSTFCAIKAMLSNEAMHANENAQTSSETHLTCDQAESINVCAVFDYEEVGSLSVTGAESNIIKEIIDQLRANYDITLSNSFIISSDVAHGLNSNYDYKYQEDHAPVLGSGIVIKHSNRYNTNCVSAAFIKSLGSRYQEFCLKNTCPGGSTIGPMLSANLGINGVDLGTPILGMHSIKEVSHVDDVYETYLLFKKFFDCSVLFDKN